MELRIASQTPKLYFVETTCNHWHCIECQWHHDVESLGGNRFKGHIKDARQHHLIRGYASQGSTFSRYTGLSCLATCAKILSSSLCGCSRQFCIPTLPMHLRCGLQPRLALALSRSLCSSQGLSSAELPYQEEHSYWKYVSGAAADASA